MLKKDIKVGMRVFAIESLDGNRDTKGRRGTVIGINSRDELGILVEFDSRIDGGHNGGRGFIGKEEHCYWGRSRNLIKIDDESKPKISFDELMNGMPEVVA